ncbi:lipopolysaccharide-induced tumor necrosis factor-alpha factor homolog [Schistocerca nitens]|uniref:lipopolysaccharide-induced tumor necrosis factor-alpha factor homolog n=1 Tax=Schistocerca cancellata TaxID=274614 RepID=UPI002117E208|nr:lipopolysaccharide-induced tumor necrosis factor-alpha factor homolog [Schistocerca cancellata]XP_049801626.1 lipopolysaccharide-induced tumor necrosis factor-alpha factor homolog [Schistocerca nitens]
MAQPQQYAAVPQAAAVISTPLGPEPTTLQCPSCHKTVTTEIRYKSNTKTHIVAVLLFVFLCWPCICVPYCTGCCRVKEHYCPGCNAFLGAYDN